MNGAQALAHTLVACGVDVCFSNPGTSEMQFVAALDSVPEMRGVLGLFEGVATGAADGYARVAGRPAATLLHLGPGLGNGIANLHNARRAHSPLVNIVGDHATYHHRYDSPLESDIEGLARAVSGWYLSSSSAEEVARDAADAVAAALGPPGQVATLVLQADLSWMPAPGPAAPRPRKQPSQVDETMVDRAARVLSSGEPCALLVGGVPLREPVLVVAQRVASMAGAKLMCETLPAVHERGGGLPEPERLAHLSEFVDAQLSGMRHLVLAGAKPPASFFAYPGRRSDLVPEGCEVQVLATAGEDVVGALTSLAEALAAAGAGLSGDLGLAGTGPRPGRPARPTGPLSAEAAAAAIGALLPEGAIVSDEAVTSSIFLPGATVGGPRHEWMSLAGGAIGQGLPLATGAAVACPDRKVLCLEADGSAMYTLQALWTQAREGLDVTTVVFNNGSYAILEMELARVGVEATGERARAMLELHPPRIDFASLAAGMGVHSARATTAQEFTAELERALAEPGPALVDAIVSRIF